MHALRPLNLFSFPRAIIHVDGDSFFASCEIAKNPALQGKAVITGVERGIVSSLSYAAKSRGIKRAMRLSEVQRICPDAVLLPSDYETYSLYSLRMFNILRRFTPDVEEYSIDEGFADLTGLQRPSNLSYEKLGAKIKATLDQELGMTFSVGLAPTKVLAKIGSKWQKPSGFTAIPGRDIHLFLNKLPLEKVWGIGPATSAFLRKYRLHTAYDLANAPKDWIKKHLTKPHYEIWQELQGRPVHEVDSQPHHDYQSISKTETFTPPSRDPHFVFAQLSKNIENACIKLRRHHLQAKKYFVYLKSQDYRYYGMEIKLTRATDVPLPIINTTSKIFTQIFDAQKEYRATGVVLMQISAKGSDQLDLFSDPIRVEKIARIFGSLDALAKRFGKHAVFLGSSFSAHHQPQHQGLRQIASERARNLLTGENKRQHLGIPLLGETT